MLERTEMKNNLFKKVFRIFLKLNLLMVLSSIIPVTVFAQDANKGYRFSPVNQYGINITAEYWNPIITYVSNKSGVKLNLKIGRTSADTTSFVLAQEAEFIFSNHLFSPEREQLGWKVFGRRQTPPVHGQIVVPAESWITDLKQLQGQEVAFPGPEALVAYKFPYAQLLSKDIDVKVVFGGNQDGALAQLFSGKVKAVGGNSQLLEGYARRENKKFRVLWSSVYDLALMVSPKVPEKDAKAVAEAFIAMSKDPEGRDILHRVSALIGLAQDAYFIASNGSEYVSYRRFYQTAPASLR
jgi:phosphonate transport system substrate-binding protein